MDNIIFDSTIYKEIMTEETSENIPQNFQGPMTFLKNRIVLKSRCYGFLDI